MPPASTGTVTVTAEQVERYLHEHIPLSAAMQVTVRSVAVDSVVLAAPLAPNINHRETVFGGSAAAVATLSAWCLLYVRMKAAQRANRIVIQRNTMDYDVPIDGDFTAHSHFAKPDGWDTFLRLLDRRGRARIAVAATLTSAGGIAARFEGDFVALRE